MTVTSRISPARAEAMYEAGDETAVCPACEGSGSVPVRSRASGRVFEMQCGTCRGEGVL